MATEATVRSGSYPRMVQAHDAGVQITSVACPGLASLIQRGDRVDEEGAAMVSRYTAPLTEAGVDTVILGCTHFPMIARLLRRSLPGATLIDGRSEIAREVADALARRRLLRPTGPEGTRRFACSGDPEAFRRLGPLPADAGLGVWRFRPRRPPPRPHPLGACGADTVLNDESPVDDRSRE
jgi:glutamate racemase